MHVNKPVSFLFLIALSFGSLQQMWGQFIVSGQAGLEINQSESFGESKSKQRLNQSFLFSPRLAYGFKNMVAGVDVGLNYQDLEVPKNASSFTQVINREISVAPFLRWVKKTGDFFGLWLELQPGFVAGDSETGGKTSGSYWGLQAGLRPGILIFINSRWSLETSIANIGYRFTRNYPTGATDIYTDESRFGLNANRPGLVLGVNYVLIKPKDSN